MTYIKQCWDKCINSDLRLPKKQIKLFDKEGNTMSIKAYEGINSGKILTLDEIRPSGKDCFQRPEKFWNTRRGVLMFL